MISEIPEHHYTGYGRKILSMYAKGMTTAVSTIKEMMEAEMDNHLGHAKSERSDNDDSSYGYKSKRINSCYGSMDIKVNLVQ